MKGSVSSKFVTLAPCALAHYFQDLYNSLSSPLTQSAYLNSMLTPARHSRQLQSIRCNPLYIPLVKLKAATCKLDFTSCQCENIVQCLFNLHIK